ncbi:MAG: hypothetical protein WBD13_12115 [Burkholderiaceae bacterium]
MPDCRSWFYADTGRQLTLDSVELRKAGCTGGETSGGTCNVVSNSGFEVNTAGWYTNTMPILTTQAAEGNQAARISDGWISHITPVVPGTTYTASALVKSVGNSGWSGTGLNFVDGNGVKLANVVQTIPPGNQYETVTLTGSAPPGATEVQFWFDADSTRTTDIDAVDLRVVNCTD